MAYSATKKPDGNYEIFQDGVRIGTGSASVLGSYGLSETNLQGTGTPINTGTGTASGTSVPYYGQTRNADWEGPALQQETWATQAAQDSGLVDPNYLSTITSNPERIAFYVNAIAYGGYTIGDILNDMKRGELISKGDERAKSIKLIDAEMPKSAYQATAEGQRSYREAATVVPTFSLAGSMNPEILKYGANMPDQLFKTLVPLLDNTSQEFKDAVANVKSAFYDLANQQLQATTEQEKAVADYNYNQFKEQIEKQYGIQLSNDAAQAWKQIEEIENNFNTRGIAGSGMQNEAIDDYLKTVRKQDQGIRESKLTQEESRLASEMKTSGTAAQIKALIAEDVAKGLPKSEWRATKWGLVPSDDILAKYDLATLKAQFPDQSDEELKAYRDAVLDENGNYRSTLYSKYYTDISKNKQSKKATAETQVLQDTLNKEDKAYRNYDQSNPFSVATSADDAQMNKDAAAAPNPPNQPVPPPAPVAPTTQPAASSIQDQLNAAAKTAADIQKGITSYKASTTGTTSTAPKKAYNTLYDYYTGTSGAYNTWNSTQRMTDAQKAGINNYTGTSDQNTTLLKYLNG